MYDEIFDLVARHYQGDEIEAVFDDAVKLLLAAEHFIRMSGLDDRFADFRQVRLRPAEPAHEVGKT